MTGEITLSGLVLPVGGIREKALAARRHGVKTMILPQMNEVDLDELPADVRQDMTFVPVRTLEEALAVSLPAVVAAVPQPDACARSSSTSPGTASATPRGRSRSSTRSDARSPARRHLLIRTSAPRWLFDRTVRVPFRFFECPLRYRHRPDRQPAARRRGVGSPRGDLLRDVRGARRPREAAFLHEHRVDLVVSDAPPLGVRGRRARRAPVDRHQQLHLGLDLQRLPRPVRSPRAARAPHHPAGLRGGVGRLAAADARRVRRRSARSGTCRASRGTPRSAREDVAAPARAAGGSPAGALVVWRLRRRAISTRHARLPRDAGPS